MILIWTPFRCKGALMKSAVTPSKPHSVLSPHDVVPLQTHVWQCPYRENIDSGKILNLSSFKNIVILRIICILLLIWYFTCNYNILKLCLQVFLLATIKMYSCQICNNSTTQHTSWIRVI